jgi:hypothetical protein
MAGIITKAAGIWICILFLAILNGIAREKLWAPLVGKQLALPLSGLLLSAVIFSVTLLLLPVLGVLAPKQYWRIGFMWLGLTVLFEFFFGRFILGNAWEQILEAYNVFSGNLWVVALLATAVSPYLAARLRGFI